MDNSLYKKYVNYKKNKIYPKKYPSTKSNFKRAAKQMVFKNNKLYKNEKIILKKSDKKRVWSEIHVKDGHSGINKTATKFKERYYMPGYFGWITDRVKKCITCARKGSCTWSEAVAPLIPIPVTPKVFWRVHVDIGGPFRLSDMGNKYFILGVDAFTKYVEGEGICFLTFFDQLF